MKIVRAADVTARTADTRKWTAGVWRADILVTRSDGLRSNRFTYAPGSRSHWHIHDGEQAIIVVDGRGLIQWEGLDAAEILAPGDWVHVSPGVAHWHGAVPDEVFTHLAVTASGPTRWLHAVDDDTYTASLPDAG
ncbi:MAG TPA: cupin domain-containing protein [Euzebyales bacterium]